MNRSSTLSMCSLSLVSILLGSLQAVAQVPAGLRLTDPIRCTAKDEFTLRNVFIQTDGHGVELTGNCEITLIDSHIVAGGAGVLVSSNGEVHLENSYVEGGAGGLVVEGTGDIYFQGTTVRGGTRASGLGDLHDRGGNDVSGSPGRMVFAGAAEIHIEGVVSIGEGFVRLDSPEGSITISDGWRRASSRYSAADTDRLLIELGANSRDGRIELTLTGDVLFDFDATAIRADAAMELAKLAHVLREQAASDIVVIGHTDSVGEDGYNQKLSEARAVAVMRWLSENESIPPSVMKAQGMGSKRPLANNARPDGSDDPAGRANNRRVEIQFAAR